MRFDRNRRSSRPAGLARRDQWKLILLIFGLGVVLLGYDMASNPEMWSRFEPPKQPSVDATVGPSDSSDAGVGDKSSPAADLGLITADELTKISDNDIGFSRVEGPIAADVLRRLSKLRNATLNRIGRRDVAYSVLMADPEIYRGDAIHIAGQIRRLTPIELPGEVGDLSDLLEGWVFTPDSDIQPYRVIMRSAADEVPRGEKFEPLSVQFTGVFFKRQAYASNAGTSVAPLLLAKRVNLAPTPPQQPKNQLAPLLLGAITIAMAAICGAFLATLRRQSRRRIEFRMANAELDGPGDIPSEPPSEFFASLEIDESDTEPSAP